MYPTQNGGGEVRRQAQGTAPPRIRQGEGGPHNLSLEADAMADEWERAPPAAAAAAAAAHA